MGTLRLLLALLVAGAHLVSLPLDSYWRRGGSAIFAVKAFFVMSGFYMALVLETHYRRKPVRDFYVSRALRLLPAYWVISVATFVIVWALAGTAEPFSPLLSPLAAWRNLSLGTLPFRLLAYVFFSLVTLLGSDTWLWLGFSPGNGHLSVAPQYAPNATSVLTLTAIPQAWTLGIEILFYLLAPVIARRTWPVLCVLALLSLASRFGLARYGFSGEPWSRALFPSELIFFLAGIASYRVYRRLDEHGWVPREYQWFAFGLAIAIVLGTGPWVAARGQSTGTQVVPYIVLAAALPFVFMLTRASAIDRLFGNLSYPVYLIQILVFGVVERTPLAALKRSLGPGVAWLALNFALVIGAALLVEWQVQRRVDRMRAAFGARPAKTVV